jgi:branched-subunit amino acid ABC-type transport system permease component
VNVTLVFTLTVLIGFALAGLAGGLLLANQSLSPELAGVFIIQAFGVIIVGGMGSVRGAFLAALLLGLFESIGSYLLPELPGLLFFAAMVVIILVRPQGLLGKERLA